MPSVQSEFERLLTRFLGKVVTNFERLHRCERLTGGANQETYRIEITVGGLQQTYALRRAAGGQQLQSEENIGLHQEATLIEIVGKHGIPVPEIIAKLHEDDGLGEGFLMPWLDGETRGARIVRDQKYDELRKSLAFKCGVNLAKIHSINIQDNHLDELLPTRTPESFIRATWERYQALDVAEPMLDYTAQWLLSNLPQTQRKTLVHNDFRNGNLMVDQNEIVAVLDWEVAHIGDPYRDLGWICTKSWAFGGTLPVGGFGLKEDLFAGYSSVTKQAVNAQDVIFWEVFGSFWWGVGCLMMAEQYRSGPDASVERPAIGRRTSECQMDCVNLIIPGKVNAVSVAQSATGQMANADELLKSVGEFLRDEVMAETAGRTNFLARVAANSIEIVRREATIKPVVAESTVKRLDSLLGNTSTGSMEHSIEQLNRRLVEAIRSGQLGLSNLELQAHLRQSVFEQLSIDQPNYPGLALALDKKN